MSIGRPFRASPLVPFYLARLSNRIAAMGLAYLATKTVPVLEWPFVMIALSPMAMFQMAFVSAGGVTIGLSLLVVALFASCAWGHEAPSIQGRGCPRAAR
jgi:uncharacterized membrane protein